eukprot:TRINITY_DN1792_c0_g1_i3.p1 TRINITY_DN1792_c0_g1~~TRINITY_DN1792_c0_g1_i3.p1  ORF type:complete len:360 (+),score=23.55 TRINITY_DN1792_c0_g1_i3:98-1177(+)
MGNKTSASSSGRFQAPAAQGTLLPLMSLPVYRFETVVDVFDPDIFGVEVPVEVQLYVCQFLTPGDLATLSQVCRHFRTLCMMDDVWQPRVRQRFSAAAADVDIAAGKWRDRFIELYLAWDLHDRFDTHSAPSTNTFASQKVVIVGGPGCGKSCLHQRWAVNAPYAHRHNVSFRELATPPPTHTLGMLVTYCYSPQSVVHDQEPTIGALDSSRWYKIRSDVFQLEIWDVSGQRKFRPLLPMYLRSAATVGIALCYSITSRDSFRELDWYLSHIRKSASSKCVIILGLKADDEENREVPTDEGRRWAEDHAVPLFFEVSSLLPRGVELSLYMFLRAVLEARDTAEPPQQKGRKTVRVSELR